MYKIDLNRQMVDLKNEPKEIMIGSSLYSEMNKILAEILAMGNSSQSIKIMNVALKLYDEGVIDMDETDYSLLYEIVDKNDMLANIWKAQILKALQDEKLKNIHKEDK